MKSILFILNDLSGGGAEKALIELLKAFDFSRYKVSLCLLFREGIYLDDIPNNVNLIILYEGKNSFYRKSFRYYYKYNVTGFLAWQIRRKINRHYDVIISFMEGLPLLFHSFVVDRSHKNITWVHCDLLEFHYTEKLYNRGYEQKCYGRMDSIVFVSNTAMQNFDKLFQINVSKHIIYNIIDVECIRMLANQDIPSVGKTVIVAIGSLFDVKGFDRLIRVVKVFKDNGYSVFCEIIGQGGKEEELRRLRDGLGLQEEVEFLGFKKPPYPYLKAADILVNTSLSEGLPFVICEAFVLGIPVVATKTAGAIELLDNGEYGILTEHDDLSIYEGIKRLIDDQELRKEYQYKSKVRAEIFDVEKIMQQVYNLISG